MKIIKISILLFISIVIGFCYGYLVHRNKIFPYNAINKIYMQNLYRKHMQWSIGVYEGATPFDLADLKGKNNPVISSRDVKDIDAAFVADPFMTLHDQKYHMFFEVLNMDTFTGDIGYALSQDGKTWSYKKIILNEDFHLSYPGIYEWEGNYYMVPESSEDLSVRIYKATSFPDKWEYQGNLISGLYCSDPTLFCYESKWWMFTSTPGMDTLNLFYSDSLTSGWLPHPLNPIIQNNKHIARPAGSVFEYNDKLYRLAQDDYPHYGIQVFAVEITELTTTTYKENTDSAIQIVSMTGKGWNSAGMHHVDLHKVGDKWLGIVDGLKRRP